ncbi:MAG: hypothetical protein U1E45_14375 [Geminicoccaceae bacterium]
MIYHADDEMRLTEIKAANYLAISIRDLQSLVFAGNIPLGDRTPDGKCLYRLGDLRAYSRRAAEMTRKVMDAEQAA